MTIRGTPISQRMMPFIAQLRVVAIEAVTRSDENRSCRPRHAGNKKAGLPRPFPLRGSALPVHPWSAAGRESRPQGRTSRADAPCQAIPEPPGGDPSGNCTPKAFTSE